MYKVINLLGVPDDRRLLVTNNGGSINQLSISIAGSNTLSNLLEKTQYKQTNITLSHEHDNQVTLQQADVIVSLICDPETNRHALQHAKQLLQNNTTPIINRPTDVEKTTRDMIYDLLHTVENIQIPKTIKVTPTCLNNLQSLIEDKGISFPYIFRSTGEHGGSGMQLLEREEDLHKLEQFAFDGRSFYVIEFVDFQSSDQLYRKTRYFVVDGEVYFRHHVVTDTWKIHAESRHDLMDDREDLREEEKRLMVEPTSFLAKQCREIYDILGLDIFGIDCCIQDDGSMLIFEINTCMNTEYGSTASPKYTTYAYLQHSADKIKKAFNLMVENKIKKLNGVSV